MDDFKTLEDSDNIPEDPDNIPEDSGGQRDIYGNDFVAGDKIMGDKVAGDKHVHYVSDYKELHYRDALNWDRRKKMRACDLSNRDLSSLDFQKADFAKSKFQKAKLWHTNFSSAILSEVDFQGASLENAIFKNITARHANFRNAKFRNNNFNGAILENANFQNTNLSNALISNSQLNKVDFTNANLQSAILKNSKMQGSILRGANLSGADFANVNLKDSKVHAYQLRETLSLLNTITPDGLKYNGCLNLPSDIHSCMINFWVSQVAETDLLTYVVKISFAVKSYNTIYKKSEFTPPLIHFLPKYYGVSREEFEKGQETAKNIQKHNLIAAVQNDKRKWRLRDWSIIIFSIIAGLVFSIINHRKESRE